MFGRSVSEDVPSMLQGISASVKERMQHAASGKTPANRPMLLFPEVYSPCLCSE